VQTEQQIILFFLCATQQQKDLGMQVHSHSLSSRHSRPRRQPKSLRSSWLRIQSGLDHRQLGNPTQRERLFPLRLHQQAQFLRGKQSSRKKPSGVHSIQAVRQDDHAALLLFRRPHRTVLLHQRDSLIAAGATVEQPLPARRLRPQGKHSLRALVEKLAQVRNARPIRQRDKGKHHFPMRVILLLFITSKKSFFCREP